MRKGRDGEEKEKKKEKIDDYNGHYVIASSRRPKRRPLERCTLVPISLAPNIAQKLLSTQNGVLQLT